MGRHLHDVEILLRDEMPLHAEAKLISPGGGEDQRGDVNAKIRDLQTVSDHNIRKSGTTNELFAVEIDQINVELIGSFGIGQAEVQTHLLMLERKTDGLQVCEEADQALLLGHAVFDDLVADQERLNARLRDIIRHNGHSTEVWPAVKRICVSNGFRDGAQRAKGKDSALFPGLIGSRLSDDCRAAATFDDVSEHREPGSYSAVVRADRHEFTLMGVEIPAGHSDLSSLKQIHFNDRVAGGAIRDSHRERVVECRIRGEIHRDDEAA